MDEEENSFPNFHFLAELVKKGIISPKTMDKVKIGISVIERKYKNKESQYIKHENVYNKINLYINNITNLSEQDKEEIKKSIFNKISKYHRLIRQRLTEKRFEIISNIGEGYLGTVKLVRDKLNNKIYAMKKINIAALLRNSQLFHIKTEKDILSMNTNNVWQTKLNYSFIDDDYLYFIIDYCPGGDLLNFFRMKDFSLTEEEAKFYIAEIILGVDNLHKNKCIHRDIKPENIFIDKYGHIKIGDFGLSALSNDIIYPYTYKWKNINDIEYIENKEKNTKIVGFSKVGSLMYVAPEVVEKKYYGEEVDWWSVGIIFYEMLVGFTPFFEGTQEEIIDKIKNYKKYLSIPKAVKDNISEEAQKLIFDFLQDKEKRLGIGGIEEIKRHPFFKDFDWDNIRQMKPPFVPELSSPDDTRYFNNKNISSIRFTNRLKRTNVFFNRDENNDSNKLLFSKFYFQYNRDAVETEKNINKEIMDLIQKEVEFKLANKIAFDEGSSEAKSSSESLNNISNPISYRAYSKDRININIFSPHSSSYFSHKTVSSSRKNDLKILPIRNLINQQKRAEKKNRKSDLGNTKIKLIKGPGRFYSIRINKK